MEKQVSSNTQVVVPTKTRGAHSKLPPPCPPSSHTTKGVPTKWDHNYVNVAQINEPTNYKQAMESPDNQEWKKAMDQEIRSLMKNNMWELVPLPPGKKPVGSQWIYKIKCNADGTIERYKAHFVAKGYSQIAGIDYDETFAPVVKYNSIHTILAIVTFEDLKLHHVDVNTAFLNGPSVMKSTSYSQKAIRVQPTPNMFVN